MRTIMLLIASVSYAMSASQNDDLRNINEFVTEPSRTGVPRADEGALIFVDFVIVIFIRRYRAKTITRTRALPGMLR
jgi:hypothetical protein